jgi:hypothetical protein
VKFVPVTSWYRRVVMQYQYHFSFSWFFYTAHLLILLEASLIDDTVIKSVSMAAIEFG